MISTVIIDDEKNNIESLQTLLAQFCPEISVRGFALNAQSAYDLIKRVEPQLVFLDIEMPFGNGFDLLEKLIPAKFEVIFVTAFDQYAIKAFRFAALDYLLKPLSIEALKEAVKRAKLRIGEKNTNIQIESLLNNLKAMHPGMKKIGLPAHDGLIFEDIDNIIRFEADGNYSKVFLKDGKKITISKPLKEFEEILPMAGFCRVHHSHLVNLNYIKKYFKGRGGYIELHDGTTVEVSSRKKDEFLDKFKV